MSFIKDVNKWQLEIALAEKFRDDELGKYTREERTLAGRNIDYYERGFSEKLTGIEPDAIATLNIIDAITSIVVPTLYFRNPRTICIPNKIESEDSSTIAARIIDYYRRKLEIEEVNQKVIWDAYIIGIGVYKTGYATKFGMDIKDEEKKKKKSVVDRALDIIGLGKKEEEVLLPEVDLRIIAENPFVEYVSPFDFLIDPRATSINDAMWVGQRFIKTVKELKDNSSYKNTGTLDGDEPENRTLNFSKVDQSSHDDFKTRELYEIHYRNENKFYRLVISKYSGGDFQEHYHEESIYDLKEWQFDILSFKKHGHSLYNRSDITKIQNLQDRITSTIDSILEQVDRMVPKLAYSSGDLTDQGKKSILYGGIGALVECNKDPNAVFKELNFVQLKADLQALIDQLIGLITIQTGITRAQLTGVSSSGSATEATIEQGGQNLRLSDMSVKVQAMVNRQSRKLWKIIKQFVDLQELNLISGIRGTDEETGLPKYDWISINGKTSEKLINGDYDFDIETGSAQKVDIAVVRKSFENLFNILARSEVITIMQQQGNKVVLAELLRRYLDLFPELSVDSSKIIQKIDQGTGGLIPTEVPGGAGGTTSGSNANALMAQLGQKSPTMGQEINKAY